MRHDTIHPLPRPRPRAFTLVELLVVIGIIVLLAGMAVPAIKMLSKSNNQSQATNLVRSMIDTARSIAMSQHRMAGVVFFEETAQWSRPVNSNQTAMQLFVEDYNQQRYNVTTVVPGGTMFVAYSNARNYLPAGVKVATLTDNALVQAFVPAGTGAGETSPRARAILFDANGQLLLRGLLVAPNPLQQSNGPGDGNAIYGDWNFLNATGQTVDGQTGENAISSPGFFLYNKSDFDVQFDPKIGAQKNAADLTRSAWLVAHADVVIINPNTGTIAR